MTEDNIKTDVIDQVVTPPLAPLTTEEPGLPKLTAADPGHPNYDPLKDEKVKVHSNKLINRITEKDDEVKSLKEILESTNEKLSTFEKKKKEEEDRGKSELLLVGDKLSELEKERATLASTLESTKTSKDKEILNLNARVLLMEELSRAGIIPNATEQRGLQAELEERLGKNGDTEDPSEIAKSIVAEFGKDRESNPTITTPKPDAPLRKPQKVEPTDDMKRLTELSKGDMTPEKEAEILEIQKRMEIKERNR